jgi:hypothetical protein
MSLIVVCLLSVTGVGAQAQGGTVSFRPIDTGRSVVFRVGGPKADHNFAIKTNLLYAATMTPNIALEMGLSQRFTLELSAGYNGWGNFWVPENHDPEVAQRQLDHILGRAEGRWWFRERFDGHFLGLSTLYADYKVNGMDVPLLFEKDYRYDGNAIGAGLSWGYRWRWSGTVGLEFSLGVGVVSMRYDKFLCTTDCSGSAEVQRFSKVYLGPTNAGMKLYFMIK